MLPAASVAAVVCVAAEMVFSARGVAALKAGGGAALEVFASKYMAVVVVTKLEANRLEANEILFSPHTSPHISPHLTTHHLAPHPASSHDFTSPTLTRPSSSHLTPVPCHKASDRSPFLALPLQWSPCPRVNLLLTISSTCYRTPHSK